MPRDKTFCVADLELLLHSYYSPEPFRDTPSSRNGASLLLSLQLIENGTEARAYRCTPRGNLLVERMCAIPLPVPVTRWEFPDGYKVPPRG